MNSRPIRILAIIVSVIAALVAIYQIPFVNERLSWRLDALRTDIVYFFRPPQEAVFVPTQQGQLMTATPAPSSTPTRTPLGPTATQAPTLTPTITPTPIPGRVLLPNVIYVDQHNRWNYCGPANLTMALKYWGWKGNRDDVAKVVKPGVNDAALDFITRGKTDKNVMPYELTNFVTAETDYGVVLRYGGTNDLLRQFIAAGLPVVIEKGYYQRDSAGKVTWMGHYLFVTGYDDAQRVFLVQDAYAQPGKNLKVSYDDFYNYWRAFNFIFFVVYPPDREEEVYALLGPWADESWANRRALQVAEEDIAALSGWDLYFAWFNKGTSHVQLGEYDQAAYAYDQAFAVDAQQPQDPAKRPYRMMWYQTGPYWAYHYTGRYQDVINLADVTFKTISDPDLEESLYWRAMSNYALGNYQLAYDDMRRAVYLNPNFGAALAVMQQWGIAP